MAEPPPAAPPNTAPPVKPAPAKAGFALMWQDIRANLRVLDDWKWVLTRAWSIRLLALAASLSGLEVAIQVMIVWQIKPPIPAGVFAALSGLVTVAAFIARFCAQEHDA